MHRPHPESLRLTVSGVLLFLAAALGLASCVSVGPTSASTAPTSTARRALGTTSHAVVAPGSPRPGSSGSPHSPATVTPEMFGAVGNGVTDDTAALQRALNAVPRGGVLRLRAGAVYRFTNILQADVPGETVTGDATLLATVPATSSFWITADHVTLSGLTLRTVNVTQRYYAYQQMGVRLAGVRYATLKNIKVIGSAAAGVYVGTSCCTAPMTRSSHFTIEGVHVLHTFADGIHVTGGSTYGTISRCSTVGTGDDGISMVSYQQDGAPVSHVTVRDSQVHGTTWGRGITVVGGRHITFRNIYVGHTNAAGIYIADEGAPFYTSSVDDVSIDDVTVRAGNLNPAIGHGAALIYSARSGYGVQNVVFHDIRIESTPTTAPWAVGIQRDQGTVAGISFQGMRITGGQTAAVSNTPSAVVATSGWSVNGQASAAPFVN